MSSKGVAKGGITATLRKAMAKKPKLATTEPETITELQRKFEEARRRRIKQKIQEQKEAREYLRNKYRKDEDIRLAEEIRESLINSRFKFFYQPIFDIKTKKPIFHEVFTHMIDQGGRLTEPNRYLPVSKGFGLDTWLDEVVFSTLLKKQGEVEKSIFSINLTGTTLSKYDSFFERLMYAIIERGVSPKNLMFELKFYDIDNDGMAAKFIKEAIEMKFNFVLDYVGGGPAVIHMIKKLGFSYIKVDGLEYQSLITNPVAREHLLEVVDAAKKEKIQLIMEKVETKEMYDFCEEIGFKYIQGFYLAHPSDDLQFQMKLKQ
jgi:EAL domain-containing protein (putative c-di-GMP-specific phosphodiesterase class I)